MEVKNGGYIDAIQIEAPSFIRSSAQTRATFCQDVADAIVEWIQYWHSARISRCHVL